MNNETGIISKSRPLLAMRNSGYTLGEFKILDLYLARINPLNPKTSRVKISKEEYCKIMEIDSGRVRPEQLKKYTSHFLGNVVTMDRPDGKKGYVQKVLFTTAEYNEEVEEIILQCNTDPLIFNTFFDVKNVGYVRYILKNTLNLKSAYSYKLYMLVKSKSPAYTFSVDLPEFKEKLGITAKRYEKFKFLNQEILKPCIDEINEITDTFIEYEKITKGRTTQGIKFKICENNKNASELEGQCSLYDEDDLTVEEQASFAELEAELEAPELSERELELQFIAEMYQNAIPECTPEQVTDLATLAEKHVPINTNYPRENCICDYLDVQCKYVRAKAPKNFYSYLRDAVIGNYGKWR